MTLINVSIVLELQTIKQSSVLLSLHRTFLHTHYVVACGDRMLRTGNRVALKGKLFRISLGKMSQLTSNAIRDCHEEASGSYLLLGSKLI
jgi:hypothetical protein